MRNRPRRPAFLEHGFQKGKSEVPYFVVDPATGKDRFGNKLWKSPDKTFVDHTGEKRQASLLISPEGSELLKRHSGLLKKIDSGLAQFEPVHPQDSFQPSGEIIDLGDGWKLQEWKAGDYSIVYILSNNQEQYVVKAPITTETVDFNKKRQPQLPYHDEMLMTQALSTDLAEQLEEAGVRFPAQYFASAHVLVSEFIEGNPISRAVKESLLYSPDGRRTIGQDISEYVNRAGMKENTPWNAASLDFVHPARNQDMIVEADGTVVLTDPFRGLPKKRQL